MTVLALTLWFVAGVVVAWLIATHPAQEPPLNLWDDWDAAS